MNAAAFLHWFYQPLWRRLTLYLCLSGLFSAAAGWLWAQPIYQQAAALSKREDAELKRYRAIKQNLRNGNSAAATQAAMDQLEEALAAETGRAFSLLALLDSADGELISWHPEKEGGTLTLKLSWQQTKKVLDYFSTLSAAATLSHFTLTREGERLIFKTRLVLNHEA
ncbi:HofO family protein [Erwinia oleae]|uniref:HofO family protein n=1 Tax=Erwinia oleae TaxID=796334 RepID=UPI00068CCD99|nr:hypothetical protein [Erwinia oleae]